MLTPRTRKVVQRLVLLFLVLALPLIAFVAWTVREEVRKMDSESPLVWDAEVASLERDTNLRGGAVLFVGSSSIRFWTTLADDMHPLDTVRRGFGGARVHDVMHYASRLFSGPTPRDIVLFVGTNDIRSDARTSPITLAAEIAQLIARIHVIQPNVPVHYILITPTPRRWSTWPMAHEVNQRVAEAAEQDPLWDIIDPSRAFLREDVPNPDLFWIDGLHLNADGYAIWTQAVRDHLAQTPHAPN